MTGNLFLSVSVNPSQTKVIPLSTVDLQDKVAVLRQRASTESNLPPEELLLVFCGNVLEDDSTLTTAGLQSGVTVHVLLKKTKEPPKQPNFKSDSIANLVWTLRTATKSSHYRSAMQRLNKPEVMENIMAATPGLVDDPIAQAMLRDTELLMQLSDLATARLVMEKHPCLVEAAQYVAAMVNEEFNSSGASSSNPGTSGYSFTLDALSDEDDMESSQSSDSQPHTADSSLNSTITADQLAAALAAAQAAGGGSTAQNSTPSGAAGVITSEMFSQALGQAFALTGGASSNTAPTQSTPLAESRPPARPNAELTDLEATSRRLAQHLQQMRELGLRDDTLNLQALQATDWNVQEAINLVFSGAMADNDAEDME